MGFKILLDTLNSVNLVSGPCVIAGNFVSFFFFVSVFFGHPIACHAKLKTHVIITRNNQLTVTVTSESYCHCSRKVSTFYHPSKGPWTPYKVYTM